MTLGAKENRPGRECRGGHAHLAHVIGRQHRKIRTGFDHKYGSLFTGEIDFALRRNRRGCKAFATGSEALFVDLLPRADVITGEDTVYLASVKALPVD